MKVIEFTIEVRGLSWREFYTLGFTGFKDRHGFSITLGLVFIDFNLVIGDPA